MENGKEIDIIFKEILKEAVDRVLDYIVKDPISILKDTNKK
jgi:hypothetical protein